MFERNTGNTSKRHDPGRLARWAAGCTTAAALALFTAAPAAAHDRHHAEVHRGGCSHAHHLHRHGHARPHARSHAALAFGLFLPHFQLHVAAPHHRYERDRHRDHRRARHHRRDRRH